MSPEQRVERTERRLRIAGGVLIAGLAVEGCSLLGSGPPSFLAFALIGAVLVALGSAFYLGAILTSTPDGPEEGADATPEGGAPDAPPAAEPTPAPGLG